MQNTKHQIVRRSKLDKLATFGIKRLVELCRAGETREECSVAFECEREGVGFEGGYEA